MSRAELRQLARQHEREYVQEQRLQPVGIDGAVGVGYVEAMVLGMDDAVQGAVDVAEAVGEVDPGVDDDEGECVLEHGHSIRDDGVGQAKFESCGLLLLVVTPGDYVCEAGAGALRCDTQLLGVNADCSQCQWDDASNVSKCQGGGMDFASFVTDHGWSIPGIEKKANGNLHHMIAYDYFQALPFGDVISLELVFAGMDPQVGENLVCIEKVKECSRNGVDDCG